MDPKDNLDPDTKEADVGIRPTLEPDYAGLNGDYVFTAEEGEQSDPSSEESTDTPSRGVCYG